MLALATERRQNKSFQFSERGRARPTAPRRAGNGGGRDPIAITTATATEHGTATACATHNTRREPHVEREVCVVQW